MDTAVDTITISRNDAYSYAMSVLRIAIESQGKDGEVARVEDIDHLLPALAKGHVLTALRDISQYVEEAASWRGACEQDAEVRELENRLGLLPADYGQDGPFSVEVPREAFQRIVRIGVAYALGRSTYMVSWQASMAEAHARDGHLDEETIDAIIRMIASRKAQHDGRTQSGVRGAHDSAAATSAHEPKLARGDLYTRHLIAFTAPASAPSAGASSAVLAVREMTYVSGGMLGMQMDYERWVQALDKLREITATKENA